MLESRCWVHAWPGLHVGERLYGKHCLGRVCGEASQFLFSESGDGWSWRDGSWLVRLPVLR
jgi:hypothetical protein